MVGDPDAAFDALSRAARVKSLVHMAKEVPRWSADTRKDGVGEDDSEELLPMEHDRPTGMQPRVPNLVNMKLARGRDGDKQADDGADDTNDKYRCVAGRKAKSWSNEIASLPHTVDAMMVDGGCNCVAGPCDWLVMLVPLRPGDRLILQPNLDINARRPVGGTFATAGVTITTGRGDGDADDSLELLLDVATAADATQKPRRGSVAWSRRTAARLPSAAPADGGDDDDEQLMIEPEAARANLQRRTTRATLATTGRDEPTGRVRDSEDEDEEVKIDAAKAVDVRSRRAPGVAMAAGTDRTGRSGTRPKTESDAGKTAVWTQEEALAALARGGAHTGVAKKTAPVRPLAPATDRNGKHVAFDDDDDGEEVKLFGTCRRVPRD